ESRQDRRRQRRSAFVAARPHPRLRFRGPGRVRHDPRSQAVYAPACGGERRHHHPRGGEARARVHGCGWHHDRSRGAGAALDLPRDLALSFNGREAPAPSGLRNPCRAARASARTLRVLWHGNGGQGRSQAYLLVYQRARWFGELPAPHESARKLRRATRPGQWLLPGVRAREAAPALRGGAGGMRQTNEIADCVRRSLERYFKDLDGAKPRAIYDMVLKNVERPMLELVLDRAEGNQSIAAEMLGINRNTLRKKIQSLKIKM